MRANGKRHTSIHYTIDELYKRANPDLVTISGDLSWCGDFPALECLASKLDSFGVPYTAIWGNHDQDGGMDKLEKTVELFKKHPLFIYEEGPKELGNGNFVDTIKECGITKTLIAGHDHTNCFHIKYEGVRFVYSLKTGPGCYYKPSLNGGTVIKIDTNGVKEIYHEFVDILHIIDSFENKQ